MKPQRFRYLVFGVLCTILAAAGFAVLFIIINGGFREGLASFVAQAVLAIGLGVTITSWFVIPLGLVLGIVFPRIVLGGSANRAVVRASALGIAVGLAVAGCLAVLYDSTTIAWWLRLTVPYCFVSAIGATLWLRRIAAHDVAA